MATRLNTLIYAAEVIGGAVLVALISFYLWWLLCRFLSHEFNKRFPMDRPNWEQVFASMEDDD